MPTILEQKSVSRTSIMSFQVRRATESVSANMQVLGTFSNGRVESWIHMRALKPEEMCTPDMAACIARRLAHFHNANIMEDKKPQIFETILDWYVAQNTCIACRACIPVYERQWYVLPDM